MVVLVPVLLDVFKCLMKRYEKLVKLKMRILCGEMRCFRMMHSNVVIQVIFSIQIHRVSYQVSNSLKPITENQSDFGFSRICTHQRSIHEKR